MEVRSVAPAAAVLGDAPSSRECSRITRLLREDREKSPLRGLEIVRPEQRLSQTHAGGEVIGMGLAVRGQRGDRVVGLCRSAIARRRGDRQGKEHQEQDATHRPRA